MSKHDAKHVTKSKQKNAASRAAGRGERWAEVSQDDGAKAPARSAKRGPRKALFIVLIVVAVLVILAELAILLFGHFYSKMTFSTGLTESEKADAIASYTLTGETAEPLPEDGVAISGAEVDDIQALIQDQLARRGGSKMSDEDVINVLLIGTDARTMDESARSDVMILASLNKKTHKIVLTSFMRDIYTYIPDYGYNRLNTPYAIAGAGYLIDTLEADFGVEIDNYAAVNFYAFSDIIDALGGIDIPVTNAEVDEINEQVFGEQAYLGIGEGTPYLEYTDGAVTHLNGSQALAHCRNRHSAGSDSDRTERQRTVLAAVLEKAKALSLTELYNLANIVLPMVTTDLTQADCLSLLLKSGEYLGYEVQSLRMPAVDYSDAYINGMAVIQIDFAANAQVLQDAIYN